MQSVHNQPTFSSSETSLDFQRTTRRHIPEERIFHENVKPHTEFLYGRLLIETLDDSSGHGCARPETFVAHISASGAGTTALLVLLPTCFTLVSRLAYFWTLKTGTTYASKTWVDFRPITRYILEGRTLQKNLFSVFPVFCPLFLLYPSSSFKSMSPISTSTVSLLYHTMKAHLGPSAGAPARARTCGAFWGASCELPAGADLNSGRRPASVDSGGVCTVVRGIQGT